MKVECPQCGESWKVERWDPWFQCESCKCGMVKSAEVARTVNEKMRQVETLARDLASAAELTRKFAGLHQAQTRLTVSIGQLHKRISILNNRMQKTERSLAGGGMPATYDHG